MSDNALHSLKKYIREIPDFPQKGIVFRDITPLLATPAAFQRVLDALREACPPQATHVAAIDARGFIFGAAVAAALQRPFIPIRKPGKLPHKTVRADYALEYGVDALAMHADALSADAQVFLIDDLIATGGTLAAAVSLVEQCGAGVGKIACVIELNGLRGREKIAGVPFTALMQYD